MPWPFPEGRQVTFTAYTFNERTQERTAVGDPVVLEACAFGYGEGREVKGREVETRDGTTLVETATVYGPYDAAVTPGDTAVVEGIDGSWEVAGSVKRWANDLSGTKACSEIPLMRKAGAA